jgi:hypothetical protein
MATAGWLASGGTPGHHSHGFPSSSAKKNPPSVSTFVSSSVLTLKLTLVFDVELFFQIKYTPTRATIHTTCNH